MLISEAVQNQVTYLCCLFLRHERHPLAIPGGLSQQQRTSLHVLFCIDEQNQAELPGGAAWCSHQHPAYCQLAAARGQEAVETDR